MPEATPDPKPEVGRPFIPWRKFRSIVVIPVAIFLNKDLSHAAKLMYGRLLYYAGKDGKCYPLVGTLAKELGITRRQARSCLRELEQAEFIKRNYRVGTSSFYTFLWHKSFEASEENDPSVGKKTSSTLGNKVPPEETDLREGREEKIEIDCPTARHTNRDAQSGLCDLPPSRPRQHPKLKEVLTRYYRLEGFEELEPSDAMVARVLDAGAGATEDEVIACLAFHYNELGLRPGTTNGPRNGWSWFVSVVQKYFEDQKRRYDSTHPCGYGEWESRNDLMAERRGRA
jgi:hypothetical protein